MGDRQRLVDTIRSLKRSRLAEPSHPPLSSASQGFLLHRWDRTGQGTQSQKRDRLTMDARAAGPGMPPWQRSIVPSTARLSDLGLLEPTRASNALLYHAEIGEAGIALV